VLLYGAKPTGFKWLFLDFFSKPAVIDCAKVIIGLYINYCIKTQA
jgi:hypothetical protein